MEEYKKDTNSAELASLEVVGDSRLETYARYIVGIVIFVLPFFLLPFSLASIDFSKGELYFLGISLALLFFVFAQLKNGIIVFPKSVLLKSLVYVSVVWFVSALFSANRTLSLWGTGYETGTFLFFLFIVITVFLISVLFRSEKKIISFYRMLFVSAIVLLVAQLVYTIFGTTSSVFPILNNKLMSMVGDWNDLGIFFGLIAILSLSGILFANIGKKLCLFLWAMILVSLGIVALTNFSIAWFILGSSMLALLVFSLVSSSDGDTQNTINFGPCRPLCIVAVIIICFAFAQGFMGGFTQKNGFKSEKVSLPVEPTIEIVKNSLKGNVYGSSVKNMLLGTGPSTFMYDFIQFKSKGVVNSVFWDTRIQSGSSRLVSFVAETGVLGGVAILIFIMHLLYSIKRIFVYKEHGVKRALLISSFVGSAYLWLFVYTYSPGFLISVFAGIFTGIFIASLIVIKNITVVEVVFEKNGEKNLLIRGILYLIMVLSFYGVYTFIAKNVAGYFVKNALETQSLGKDLSKTEHYLRKAVWLDPQDAYYRYSAEAGVLQLREIFQQLERKDVSEEERKLLNDRFEKISDTTILSAEKAVKRNPIDPINLMQQGRIYELLMGKRSELKDKAIASYLEAKIKSPHSPAPLLALAQVELLLKNPDAAMKYLQQSLIIKQDFSIGSLRIAQVAIEQGRIKDGIAELARMVNTNPNNPDNPYLILQIAILYEQDGDYKTAQNTYEYLIGLKQDYIEGRKYLALFYNKRGMTEKAIVQFEILSQLVPGNEELKKIIQNLRSGKDISGKEVKSPEPEVKQDVKTPVKK